MTAAELLSIAAKLITGSRAESHGDLAENFKRISNMWNAYLGTNLINSKDVAIMMALMKAARAKTGNNLEDHFIDMAGYSAIAGQVAENDEEPNNSIKKNSNNNIISTRGGLHSCRVGLGDIK